MSNHQFANSLILAQVKPFRNMSIAKLSWFTGAAGGGNFDIAIYNDSGVLLWSKGLTAWPAGNVEIVQTESPVVSLLAGTRYWAALGADTTTAQWRGLQQAVSGAMRILDGTPFARTQSNAFPAPSAFAIAATESGRVPLAIFREA